jgi:hypothetical protein
VVCVEKCGSISLLKRRKDFLREFARLLIQIWRLHSRLAWILLVAPIAKIDFALHVLLRDVACSIAPNRE